MKYEFEDTTAISPGLYREDCEDSGISEECRTFMIPTDTARPKESKQSVFEYHFKI